MLRITEPKVRKSELKFHFLKPEFYDSYIVAKYEITLKDFVINEIRDDEPTISTITHPLDIRKPIEVQVYTKSYGEKRYLELMLDYLEMYCEAIYFLSIKDISGNEKLTQSICLSRLVGNILYDDDKERHKSDVIHWKKFIQHDYILENYAELVKDNSLTFMLEIHISCKKTFETKLFEYEKSPFPDDVKLDIQLSKRKGESFRLYYNSEEFQKLSELSIPFQCLSDIKSSEVYLEINASESWAFINMISFITSRTIGAYCIDEVIALYSISCKYLVEDMRQICSEALKKLISVDSVDCILNAAEKHNDCDLHEHVLNYTQMIFPSEDILKFDDKLRKSATKKKKFRLYRDSKKCLELCKNIFPDKTLLSAFNELSYRLELLDGVEISENYIEISAYRCWELKNIISFSISKTIGTVEKLKHVRKLMYASQVARFHDMANICAQIFENCAKNKIHHALKWNPEEKVDNSRQEEK